MWILKIKSGIRWFRVDGTFKTRSEAERKAYDLMATGDADAYQIALGGGFNRITSK